jgi:dTDP-4-amino-4,6-dideoxygalactose transaminase
MIPFLDLSRIHLPLKQEFIESFGQLIDDSEFILGNSVEKFEQEFAQFCGSAFCVSVNTGTSALHLALGALGIGEGDEVIVPAMTFIATAASVSYTGATPRFVDIDSETWNIDPSKIEAAINSKTRAILPVHLHGLMADMPAIMKIAEKHGLHVIEDAAQAHGASINGKGAGTFGVAGCFSFYPGKNLGALGEGGAVTTDNVDLQDKIKLLRNWGSRNKYIHEVVAYNNRLESVQAAMLTLKLKHLDLWTKQRQEARSLYQESLEYSEFAASKIPNGFAHVNHIFAVCTKNRDKVTSALTSAGIGWGIHYPVPLHLQPAFAELGYQEGDFPVSERLGNEWISLPLFPGITVGEISQVVSVLKGI